MGKRRLLLIQANFCICGFVVVFCEVWEAKRGVEGREGKRDGGGGGRHEAQAPSNLVKNYKQTER